MAIKRLDPKAITKLVSISDEAIDKVTSDVKAYADTLDVSHLKFKEGELPTYFIIQNVDATLQAELKEKHYKIVPPTIGADGKPIGAKVNVVGEGSMMIEYFKAGVKFIEDNGVQEPADITTVPFIVIQEIGSYVMVRTSLGDKLKKTSK
jgi:hypothetical protein